MSGDLTSLGVAAAIGAGPRAYESWCRVRSTVDVGDCWDADLLALLPAVWSHTVALHPDDAEAPRLRGVHHHRWCTSMVVARQLVDAHDVLQSADLDARVAGGLAIVSRAYADLGSRRVDDSVLLVSQEQLPEAVGALRRAGFTVHPAGAAHRLPNRRLVRASPVGGGPAFGVVARPSPWFTGLPASTDEITVAGRTVRVLSVEDELLALLCGGSHDVTVTGVQWVIDAGRFAVSGIVDPGRLVAAIDEQRLSPVVLPRLRRLVADYDVEIGPGVVDAVAALQVHERDRRLARWAANPITPTNHAARALGLVRRWLVTSRCLPWWQVVASGPRYVW